MTTPLPRCAMMSSLDCRRHATIASYGVGMQRAAVGLGTRPRPWVKLMTTPCRSGLPALIPMVCRECA